MNGTTYRPYRGTVELAGMAAASARLRAHIGLLEPTDLAAGATSAYLGVDTDNHNRALALYESCGFRVVTRSANYRKPFEPGKDRR